MLVLILYSFIIFLILAPKNTIESPYTLIKNRFCDVTLLYPQNIYIFVAINIFKSNQEEKDLSKLKQCFIMDIHLFALHSRYS